LSIDRKKIATVKVGVILWIFFDLEDRYQPGLGVQARSVDKGEGTLTKYQWVRKIKKVQNRVVEL
jgi:hypothetical protein